MFFKSNCSNCVRQIKSYFESTSLTLNNISGPLTITKFECGQVETKMEKQINWIKQCNQKLMFSHLAFFVNNKIMPSAAIIVLKKDLWIYAWEFENCQGGKKSNQNEIIIIIVADQKLNYE